MADRSNYADSPSVDTGALVEHRIRFGDENRAYTPTAGESDSPGHFGGLADGASGDWSWKPGRDKLLGDQMQTFKGVPPSAAELHRSAMHQPG